MRRRKVVRRGLAAAALLAVFAVLAWWVGPKLRQRPPAPTPQRGDVSLLMVEAVSVANAHFRLVRITFRDGQMLPPETLWDDRDWFFNHSSRYHVIDNRFIVNQPGGVFDLTERQVIHRGAGTLIEVDGSTVVSALRQQVGWSDVTAFDVQTRQAERRDDPKYQLRGVRSPDGTKSVELGPAESTLHQLGQPPRALGGGFLVNGSVVLWLDNEQILAQTGNGVLELVSLDGTRKPVVSIPVGEKVAGAPRLSRDQAGRIIYSCGAPYVVDVETKTWKLCEWVALGHGFETDWDGTELRYQGERIEQVRCWPHWVGRMATTEGYVALMTGEGQRQLRVWATTGEWFTIDREPECLVGWVR